MEFFYFKTVTTSKSYLQGGDCVQANYECDPGYEIFRVYEDEDHSDERPLVRSANRVCSQSGIWLPEERIQCVKTRWAANSLF